MNRGTQQRSSRKSYFSPKWYYHDIMTNRIMKVNNTLFLSFETQCPRCKHHDPRRSGWKSDRWTQSVTNVPRYWIQFRLLTSYCPSSRSRYYHGLRNTRSWNHQCRNWGSSHWSPCRINNPYEFSCRNNYSYSEYGNSVISSSRIDQCNYRTTIDSKTLQM